MDQLTNMVLMIEDELKKELRLLDYMLDDLYPLWENTFKKSWMEDMNRRLKIEKSSVSNEKVKLCLLRMPCDLIVIDEFLDEDKSLHVAVGITVETYDNSDGSQVRVDMISEKLKILSESNRFKIMTMLTKKVFMDKR